MKRSRWLLTRLQGTDDVTHTGILPAADGFSHQRKKQEYRPRGNR